MSNPFWKKQSELPSNSDIVIIGGGFIGLSVAYWLKKRKPTLSLMILDSRELGEGASGRNAGFLTKGSLSFYQHLSHSWGQTSAEDIFDFADESIRLLMEHFALAECFPTSSLTLYARDQDYHFKGFKKVASPFDGIHSCFASDGEASINPLVLLRMLEEHVKNLGVKIYRGVEVLHLSNNLLATSFGEVKTSQVVVALNGFTNSLISGLVTPQRAQMLCVQLKNNFECQSLVYEPDSRVYFKTVGANKLIIGGKRLLDPQTEETNNLGINHKIQQGLEDYVQERIGAIESIQTRWSGIMGFSNDELPIIEKRNEYYLITGFSGHGMGFGFNASRNLSDMMIDNKSSFFHSIRCRVNKP